MTSIGVTNTSKKHFNHFCLSPRRIDGLICGRWGDRRRRGSHIGRFRDKSNYLQSVKLWICFPGALSPAPGLRETRRLCFLEFVGHELAAYGLQTVGECWVSVFQSARTDTHDRHSQRGSIPSLTKDRVKAGFIWSHFRKTQHLLIASVWCFCQNQQPELKISGRMVTFTTVHCALSRSVGNARFSNITLHAESLFSVPPSFGRL